MIKQLLVDQSEHLKLLSLAITYVSDLSSSLENACEGFEGPEDEDPQATEEVKWARDFIERIEAHLKKFEVPK